MTTLKDKEIIDRLINRGTEAVLPSKKALEKILLDGKKLTIYQGFDPTAGTLHIGHTVGMRKLRDFQLLGHNVIFLIGDFTARIGDPDKKSARVPLTKEQVEDNMKLYKKQASKILNFDDKKNPVQVKYNSEWSENLNFSDILKLASAFSVQQMLKRDLFQHRIDEDRPLYLHELMYPMMQAYDAFMMKTDVQVGGNDQIFNILASRDLIEKWDNRQMIVLTTKLLSDSSGEKMSKTGGNMAKLTDSPEDIYGKIMSFTDGMIVSGYELLTDTPAPEIQKMEKDMKSGKLNPMEAKKNLSLLITKEHKSEKEAKKAQKYFEDVFQKKSNDAEIKTISVKESEISLIDLIVKYGKFTDSNSNAKRLVEQGAVSIDGKRVTDKNLKAKLSSKPVIIKAGKNIAKFTKK